MSSTTVTRATLAVPPLQPLFESPELPEFDLPVALVETYGEPLGFSEPRGCTRTSSPASAASSPFPA